MIEFDPVLVHDWLSRSANRFPDKEALIFGQQRWTYKSIEQHTNHLASALCDAGVKRQDRVVVFMDNCPEAVISLYAILKAGGVFVILNASLKGPKLSYILKNSGASLLITHTSKTKAVKDALDVRDHDFRIIWVGPTNEMPRELSGISLSWEEIFTALSDEATAGVLSSDVKLPRCIDVDLACLIYTSGSTGEPKGVMSTHHNIISAARSIIQYIGNQEDDIILNVRPLSFDYGLYQIIMAFMFEGTVVLEKSFGYLHNILKRIAGEKVTGFPIVPTVAAMLLKVDDLKQYDLSTLRYITNTADALPVSHIRKLRLLFPGVRIFSMFGLTECKRVCYLNPEELDKRPLSVGRAMPNCEVFVVDRDGSEVSPGKTGELTVRGSNVMQGYWKDTEMTAKTYRFGDYPAERILHSGDYFRKDQEGFLYFLGRKDDMIKTKGERISTKEVEHTLCSMDVVAEAAVIGVPDEILGMAIAAFIVPEAKVGLTEQRVLKYCRENMETFLVPKYIEFMDKLPKTPNGKINKIQLNNEYKNKTN